MGFYKGLLAIWRDQIADNLSHIIDGESFATCVHRRLPVGDCLLLMLMLFKDTDTPLEDHYFQKEGDESVLIGETDYWKKIHSKKL